MVVIGGDIGIVPSHLLEGSPPKVMTECQNICLGDQRQCFLGAVPPPRVLKRPANASFAALACIDRLLDGDFVRGSLLEKSTDAAVEVLGILTNDDKVDVIWPPASQWGLDTRQQFDRS